jgi:hypothetical protein
MRPPASPSSTWRAGAPTVAPWTFATLPTSVHTAGARACADITAAERSRASVGSRLNLAPKLQVLVNFLKLSKRRGP